MSSFLLLVDNISIGLYALAVAGLLFGLRRFLLARGDLSIAHFTLERERAESLGGSGLTFTLISIEILLLVYVLSNITYPAWQDHNQVVEATPVAQDFQTRVPSASDERFVVPTAVVSGPELVRTAAPTATPAGTILPHEDSVGCISEQANIRIPNNGQMVFETLPIIGTANIVNFGYYRFEIRNVDEGGSFGVIGGADSDRNQPVVDGPLGSLVPQNFTPGEYRFRMVVFDTQGIGQAACEITVFISDPLPTPTPIGG